MYSIGIIFWTINPQVYKQYVVMVMVLKMDALIESPEEKGEVIQIGKSNFCCKKPLII
jgi:hypothetical protein